VLPLIQQQELARKFESKRVSINDSPPVFLNSLRLKTFAEKGTVCVGCGLSADYFAFERDVKNRENAPYHLNLWGIRDNSGRHILFTHDHILAKSLGGTNDLTNTQTMCCDCNSKKSQQEQKVAKIIEDLLKLWRHIGVPEATIPELKQFTINKLLHMVLV